ncbi:MAG: hypothetical protein QOD77_762 [Thermoplasmata archaeon]|jgi:hypothetical protein|nr:hypothetical protein [Thermoplasmata archaeon]
MRVLTTVLLVLVLLPAAQAQMDFSQPYQLRGAIGDIPSTATAEPASGFSLEQRIELNLTAAQQIFVPIPRGSAVVRAETATHQAGFNAGQQVVFNLTAGAHTLFVTTNQAFGGRTYGFELENPNFGAQAIAIFYVPNGAALDTPVPVTQTLPCTGGAPCTIQVHAASAEHPFPMPFWVTLHPAGGAPGGTATTTTVTAPAGAPTLGQMLPWLVGALVLGALLWALLVSRGMVQARSRRQVVATAAHVEVAKAEPVPVLEGKKRALVAALKEVEVARQNNEMPVEVYDQVKADLKRQAVTVMRAIEEAGGKS